MFEPGKIIAGRYRLSRLMGEGGMGAVWSATNEAISRDVAIKVMHPRMAEDPVALQRFFNEARICGSIRNPGIVDVLDLGSAEDGSPFLVMELLLGESLEAQIEREGHLLPSVILPIVRDVARTIALAHQKEIVHRDLKPGNLFLHRASDTQTVVKVLDFGISKVLTPGSSVKATATGAVVGSPAYMSPEQTLGRVTVDERTDIYALGVILYEALSGRLPFTEDNYNALIVAIATTDPTDIASLVPGLAPKIAALVRGAMEKERDNRIKTMTELADRIDKLLPGIEEADRKLLASLDKPSEAMRARVSRSSSEGMTPHRTASVLTTNTTPHRAKRWLPVSAAIVGVVGVAGLYLILSGPSMEQSTTTGPPQPSGVASLTVPLPPTSAMPIVVPTSSSAAPRASVSAAPSASQTGSHRIGPGVPGAKKKDGGAWSYD